MRIHQNIKILLFLGIILLVTGIILRITTTMLIIPLSFIIPGAILKISYIYIKYKRGEYAPGAELIFLYVGLIIFFTGIYFKYHESPIHPAYFLATGGILKTIFIVQFIRKTRKPESKVIIQQDKLT